MNFVVLSLGSNSADKIQKMKICINDLKDVFVDVKVSDWYYTYLIDLKNKGIVSGYDDGSFKPANTVTREEFVKMAISAFGVAKGDAEAKSFSDVDSSFWAKSYIDIPFRR